MRTLEHPATRAVSISLGAGAAIFALVQCTSNDGTAGAPDGAVIAADGAACAIDAPVTPGVDGSSAADSAVDAGSDASQSDPTKLAALALIDEGRKTFRFETFGDEDFWGGTLKLHQAIEGASHGGVGPGVSPKTALGVGLKIDLDSLPDTVVAAIKAGTFDLNSPDSTLAALELGAVVGVTGVFDANKNLTSVGIQCSLCHANVDDALAPGIGHRLDGWANRDLNVGAIVNLSPDLSAVATALGVSEATVRTVIQGWGPGKFDAELFLDGKALVPDAGGQTAATLIPPAFGLAGVNLHTWTGWGSVTYWNAFVANLEMHGKGTFFDPRLDDATKFPVAAKNQSGHVKASTDLITPKLAALQFYQLALPVPTPPAGSFDAAGAARGASLFTGKAKCASCHVPPLFTEPGWNMHTGAEIGIDEFQASRSPDARYRTSPLRGLFSHSKGGFYHDGRFATLKDVVDHYNGAQSLGLTANEEADLVEYLKSL